MPIDLVIFDCDGVLVDSEPIANETFATMLAGLGLQLTQAEMFEHFVGYSMTHCLRVVEQMLGRAPPSNFLEELQSRTYAAFRERLQPIDGIHYALDHLGVPFCVASSGDHDKMKTTLGITGLLPRFEGRLFSVTQVARGKPAPDIYLFAAERCGVRPDRCVVVEDTPPGVRGAVAAGMTVFGYCAHTPMDKLVAAGAHHLVSDMRDVPDLVAELSPRATV